MQLPDKKILAERLLILQVKTNMARAEQTDQEKIVNRLTRKMCVSARQPATDAETLLGSDVSLVRLVAMPSIIAFTCLLFFRSRILFLHVV